MSGKENESRCYVRYRAARITQMCEASKKETPELRTFTDQRFYVVKPDPVTNLQKGLLSSENGS
jgi:hypothetical protein